MPVDSPPDRKCARCGELRLYKGGLQTHCKGCRRVLKDEREKARAAEKEGLLAASGALDAIETKLEDVEKGELTYEELIRQLGVIWSTGSMPDGTVAPQTIQKEALRLLERHLVPTVESGELVVRLILEAKIRCSECG